MIPAIRAEIRKLWTVRSTYYLILGGLALIILAAGYAGGYKASPVEMHDPSFVMGRITSQVLLNFIAILGSLSGLLLFAHEYRYSTITYSFTAVNSRLKFLLAKLLVTSVHVVFYTLLMLVAAWVSLRVGTALQGLHMAPQTYDFTKIWHAFYFVWGYAALALIIVALIRNLVGSFVLFFFWPGTIEGLLSLVLKDNVQYLPFTALSSVVGSGMSVNAAIDPARAVVISLIDIGILAVVAALLVSRRDAN